jgi:hypothetical protein
LPNLAATVTVPTMRSIARLLQLVGLTIPPLAVIAELLNHIGTKQLLQFLVVSVCIFLVGYLLQQYTGSK